MGAGPVDYDALAEAVVRRMKVVEAGGKERADVGGGSVLGGKGVRDGVGVGLENWQEVDRGREKQKESLSGAFGSIPESEDGDESSSGGSVSGGPCGQPSERVKRVIRFGDMGDVYPQVSQQKSAGYFAVTVKRDQTTRLALKVKGLTGSVVPRAALGELGICTYTAGTMPVAVVDGAAKLRSLAAVGDAAITMHLVMRAYRSGATVGSAQAFRSQVTSNVNFRKIMVTHGLIDLISYPSGVDPEVTSATATAFEAIVGVLVLYRPAVTVSKFLDAVGVFRSQ